MEQRLPREILWADKRKMGDFLKEPLNQKLYEVYLSIKRKTPSQNYKTLDLFNEVYYLCSRIIVENNSDQELNSIIQDIKTDLGWNYSTSLVINMIYAVLALRKENTLEVKSLVKKIESHYKFGEYKTPFYLMTESCKSNGDFYKFEPQVTTCASPSPSNESEKITEINMNGIHITLNFNNHYSGEIRAINVNSPGNIIGKEIKTETSDGRQ